MPRIRTTWWRPAPSAAPCSSAGAWWRARSPDTFFTLPWEGRVGVHALACAPGWGEIEPRARQLWGHAPWSPTTPSFLFRQAFHPTPLIAAYAAISDPPLPGEDKEWSSA